MKRIILLGFGGHARSIVDSLEKNNEFKIEGFLDHNATVGETYRGYSVLGTDELLEPLFQSGVTHAFICIGYLGTSSIRDVLYQKLKMIGYTLPNIIDPTAIIASDVSLGEGNYIGKRAVINSCATILNNCIINTAAVIEHDCLIESNCHIAVNATLCGDVIIKQETFIGASATVIHGITVSSRCIIGAGALLYKNITSDSKVYGASKLGDL